MWSGGSHVRAQARISAWTRCERQGVEWQGIRKPTVIVVVIVGSKDGKARDAGREGCWERRKARTERGAGWWAVVARRARRMLAARRNAERRERRFRLWEMRGRKKVESGDAARMCMEGRRG